jgi:2-iminobutanoate/2-iminopropanoate deaminase
MDGTKDWSAPHEIGHFSLGRWAGDVLYMAGVVAMYPGSGRAVRGYDDVPAEVTDRFKEGHISVDGREEGIVCQTWAVFDIAQQHLKAEGLTLENVVHMTVYFTDLDDFPGYHRVRKTLYPTNPPPATVVGVSGLLPSDETLLEIDFIVSRAIPQNITTKPE